MHKKTSSSDLADRWREALMQISGPTYLRIVEALQRDVRNGLLAGGDPLPSHRELANQLDINFTTVTRAYEEAKKRGLILARGGQGTFVAGTSAPLSTAPGVVSTQASIPAVIDLTSATPPNMETAPLLAEQVRKLTQDRSFDFLGRPGMIGTPMDMAAAEAWLRPRFSHEIAGCIAIASGARNALLALLGSLVGSGDTLLVEELVWPTIRPLAGMLGIELAAVPIDSEGLIPEALEEACRTTPARALYCVPTAQNPTGAMMTEARRLRIAEIARRNGLFIIEDDAYGPLHESPPAPLAALAPDITYYVVGLAKLISPSLRVAYVVAPGHERTQRLVEFLRITMQMAAPLELALNTQLIRNGMLPLLIAQVRAEVRARQRLAAEKLGAHAVFPPEAPFAWLTLLPQWPRAEFVSRLQQNGVLISPSDAFLAHGGVAPNAVRISTGSASSRAELQLAVDRIARLLQQPLHLLSGID